MIAPSVSREALASDVRAKRSYRSGYRRAQAERTRQAIIKATLALIAEGTFRADTAEIAERAGVHRTAIARRFGSVPLLYRVVAREHWIEVVPHLPFVVKDLGQPEKAAVWTVLVGEPR